MYESVTKVHTTSTIIIITRKKIRNDINCNHMRQRKLIQSRNIYAPFGVNKSNWLKKVSTISNYQYPIIIDTNQTVKATKRRHAASQSTSIIINWDNIRRRLRRLNSRSRHLLPTLTTHFGREQILTNLNVHFECDSRLFFNTSPKIYSR